MKCLISYPLQLYVCQSLWVHFYFDVYTPLFNSQLVRFQISNDKETCILEVYLTNKCIYSNYKHLTKRGKMGERDQKQKKLERILPPSRNKLYWNTVLNFLPKYSLVQTDRNMEKSSKKAQLVNTRNQKIMCRAALGASGHAGWTLWSVESTRPWTFAVYVNGQSWQAEHLRRKEATTCYVPCALHWNVRKIMPLNPKHWISVLLIPQQGKENKTKLILHLLQVTYQ